MRYCLSICALLISGNGQAKIQKGLLPPGHLSLTQPAPFEPSDVILLEDGRVLMIDDEAETPLSLMHISKEGKLSRQRQIYIRQGFPKVGPQANLRILDDLEATAIAPDGRIYLLSSLSRKGNGQQDPNRDKIVSLSLHNDRIVKPQIRSDLRATLAALSPELAAASAELDSESDKSLNIEGLAYDPRQQQLLIGFRAPLIKGSAVVVAVPNPAGYLAGAPAQLSAPQLLNLGGGGIRAITYDEKLQGFLIVSGAAGDAPHPNQLWFWVGDQSPARPIRLTTNLSLDRAEGITRIKNAGGEYLLLVFDNGSRTKLRNATFAVLDYSALEIAP